MDDFPERGVGLLNQPRDGGEGVIRARLTRQDGTPLYLLGLDAENVRRLKAGKPIMVDLGHLGGVGAVSICYGETLADIVRELEAAGLELPPAQPFGEGSA